MSNFKKTVDQQKAINEAVDAIFKHFRDEVPYVVTLETMSQAQTEIIELMELNRVAAESGTMSSVVVSETPNFLTEVNMAYNLLRPFAKMLGQVYGNED